MRPIRVHLIDHFSLDQRMYLVLYMIVNEQSFRVEPIGMGSADVNEPGQFVLFSSDQFDRNISAGNQLTLWY